MLFVCIVEQKEYTLLHFSFVLCSGPIQQDLESYFCAHFVFENVRYLPPTVVLIWLHGLAKKASNGRAWEQARMLVR